MSTNILVMTMGLSWQIVPEVLGFTNSNTLDVYANHPQKQSFIDLKQEYKIPECQEVWMIGTDPGIDSQNNNEAKIHDWVHCRSLQNMKLSFFYLRGVPELDHSYECNQMSDLILRVVLHAHHHAGDGKILLCLTGGRKTMSSDLQSAGYFFGCDALIHILESLPPEKRKPFRNLKFCCSPEASLIGHISPLMVSGHIRMNPLFTDHSKPDVQTYPLHTLPNSQLYEPQTDLYHEVNRIQKRANELYHNFVDDFLLTREQTNFRALYSLPPHLLTKLKSEKIGMIPENIDKDLNWIRQFPKTDLHIHFGGILNPKEMVRVALANHNKIEFYKRSMPKYAAFCEEVHRHIRNHNITKLLELVPDVRNLRSRFSELGIPEPYSVCGFLSSFREHEDLLHQFIYGQTGSFKSIGIKAYEQLGDLQGSGLMKSKESIRETCTILAETCQREHIKYLEIRCSPLNYVSESGLSAREVVDCITQTLLAYEEQTMFRLIFIGSRHGDPEKIRNHFSLAMNLRNQKADFKRVFAGFDLAGDESTAEPEKLQTYFEPVHAECLNITIHAGEDQDVENIWQAVYKLNADRIGHGLTLEDRPELISRFLDRKISIEMCPSSNDQIIGFKDFSNESSDSSYFKSYPLQKYMEEGLRITINTDDPGISLTTLSREYLKAAQLSPGGLSKWEVLQLIRNGFRSSFLPFTQRRELLLRAEKEVLEILMKEYAFN